MLIEGNAHECRAPLALATGAYVHNLVSRQVGGFLGFIEPNIGRQVAGFARRLDNPP